MLNSEWGLNAKSRKQLYTACVTSISDYGAEVWWNNQISYLSKFRKLQNTALRKILGAFQTSPTDALQIKAEIPPVEVRLDRKCKNYAIRIIDLFEKHLTRKKSSILYPSQYSTELNLNLNASKYLN